MADHAVRPAEQSSSSLWKRRSTYFFLGMLAIWTSHWALKQLGWLFGWTAEPVEGHLGQIFDTLVILMAGLVLMVYAFKQIARHDNERKANRDRFHELAVKAKQGKNVHA
jgi:hypothetical protein